MTERLRDIVASDDPAVADLARLVRAAGDPAPHAGAQDRVRRALAERTLPRRHRWQAAVVAVLVVFVVLPAAIAGVRWIAAPPPPPASIPPVPSPAAPSSPRVAHRAAAAAEPLPPAAEAPDPPVADPSVHSAPTEPSGNVEVAPELPTAVPAPGSAGSAASVPPRPPVPAPEPPVVRDATALPLPASERRPHVPGRATGRADDAPTPGSAVRAREPSRMPTEPATSPTAADTALVLDAMRRLRRGHDPQAALRELDAYLARSPNGDLSEEVLALAIEARAGLADPAACSLAELYLQRYPRGRFRDAAEHTQRQLRNLQRCRPTD